MSFYNKAEFLFKRKEFKEALNFCNQSIARAVPGHFLGLPHSLRSNILSEWNLMDEAVMEIDEALKSLSQSSGQSQGQSQVPLDENVVRQTKSYFESLKSKHESKLSHNRAKTNGRNLEEKNKRMEFTRELFRVKSPNPLAPALEDFVEIKWTKGKGRHLVVKKEIPICMFKFLFQFHFQHFVNYNDEI